MTDMYGRLDTSVGETGAHMHRVNPDLFPNAVEGAPSAATATVDGEPLPVTVDPTVDEVLGNVNKEGGEKTTQGPDFDPSAVGSNDVAQFESNDTPNPSVPVAADGADVNAQVAAASEDETKDETKDETDGGEDETKDGETKDGETKDGETKDGDEADVLEAPAVTEEQVKAIDAEGNAEHVKALVVARGFAEPSTKAEASMIEAQARILAEGGATPEQIVAALTAPQS